MTNRAARSNRTGWLSGPAVAALVLSAVLTVVTAASASQTGRGPIHLTVGAATDHSGNLTIKSHIRAALAVRCSMIVRARGQRAQLPELRSAGGGVGWKWQVAPGAPSGTWRFVSTCRAARRVLHQTVTALVLVPHGSVGGRIAVTGSLTVTSGHPTAKVPSQASRVKGIGKGAPTGNPFPLKWCTWGAWNKAQWLGHSVWGNANQWADEARQSQLPVDQTPSIGAVFVNTYGGLGHVGIVIGPASADGWFPTLEMNGGNLLPSPPNEYGMTDEFGSYANHRQRTGPYMFFIHQPVGDLSQYNGHIVQWDGDKKLQKTAWLVSPDSKDLHRNWIPDSRTYNCLKSHGTPGPEVLPAAVLDRMPDQNGLWASCTDTPPSGGGGGGDGGGNGGGGGDTSAPSVPGGLSVSNVSTSTLRLNWAVSTDNVGVTGYDAFLNANKVGSVSVLYGDFVGLSCGTTYTLGVDARDGAGNVSGTASLQASTSACPALSPSVIVSKGAHTVVTGCTSIACAQVVVTFSNFAPGAHTVSCYASDPPAGKYYTYTTSATTSAVCVYGYPGYQVWATVDGVESNHLTW